ncbi:uncharacterized protein LOC128201614 [Galleria mellonella]|uniref:Uncharacterized protein LOC128201614 n=1 Tax=Galleria mellonella TaxID=7137 RepID=A0ABM3MV30_GALME|nr:uncharacterized protein LOC128201614 [Galleria mellonella]
MLFAATLIILLCGSNAEYTLKCNNDTQKSLTLEHSGDEVKTRYIVQWCTVVDPVLTEWNLVLSYSTNLNKTKCKKGIPRRWNKHSEISEPFDGRNINCTNVCFSTTLDLIFSACYYIESFLPAMGSYKTIAYSYISNEYSVASFTNNIVNADMIPHGDYVAIHWYFGNITVTDYSMDLCPIDNTTAHMDVVVCENVNDNCTSGNTRNKNVVICNLWGLRGFYKLHMRHLTPWKTGSVFIRQAFTHYKFYVAAPSEPRLQARRDDVAWACGALAAAALAAATLAAAALLARAHRRGLARFRTNVLLGWQRWTAEKYGTEQQPSEGGEEAEEPLLLLYAREGPEGDPVAAALAELLQLAAPGQVIDLYRPETTAAAAAAPAAWLRALLARPRLRLVLLQTPALLLAAGAAPLPPGADGGADAFPLLARRPVYRSPLPGDALLQLALRLLAETAHVHSDRPYTKYYLATLSALPTEALPHTVPFRRYELPEQAPRLLLELAAGRPPAAATARLHHAAAHFAEHARRHPHYLRHELLLP